MTQIQQACLEAVPKKRPAKGRKTTYWWTPTIAEQRKKCLYLRRQAQRCMKRSQFNSTKILTNYKEAKKKLKKKY